MNRFTKTTKTIILIAFIMLNGCATAQNVQVWTNPRANAFKDIAYSITPFEDANSKKDKQNFPEASKVVATALETALLEAGYRVVSEGAEDASITGTVRAYYKGHFGGVYTTVSFDVKATDTKKGEVLWKTSHAVKTNFNYDYDPVLLAGKVANELVEGLSASFQTNR